MVRDREKSGRDSRVIIGEIQCAIPSSFWHSRYRLRAAANQHSARKGRRAMQALKEIPVRKAKMGLLVRRVCKVLRDRPEPHRNSA